jgi:hypothetical protein
VSNQIICLEPGTYTLPDECRVESSLVGHAGPEVTVIDSNLVFGSYDNIKQLLHGVTVTGYVARTVLVQSLIGNVILGGISSGLPQNLDELELLESIPDSVILGNHIEGSIWSYGCYWISDNIVNNGGILQSLTRCGGAVVNNVVRGAPTCIASGGRGPAFVQDNILEECGIGIQVGFGGTGYDVAVIANRIRTSETGIYFRGVSDHKFEIVDNEIMDVAIYGIRGEAVHAPGPISVWQNLIAGPPMGAGSPSGAVGIELTLQDEAGFTVAQNTIVGHETGIRIIDETYRSPRVSRILNNLVAFNATVGVENAYMNPDPSTIISEHNDVYGSATNWLGIPDPTGLDGNVSAEPLFVNPGRELFGLRPDSPCIDAGGPSSLSLDNAGAPRTLDGDGDGIATTDIGAYEFVPPDPRGLGYWKHQCSDRPFRQLSRPALEQVFSTVEELSPAFPECAPIGCETLIPDGPQNDMRVHAERHALVLWLNLAAQHLRLDTPVEIDDLPSAVIVGDVVEAIEATLCDRDASRSELEQAKDLAEALGPEGSDFELAGGRSKVLIAPGEQHQMTLGLVNMDDHPHSFDLHASGPWPTVLSISRVNGLQGGQVALIPVQISAPRFAPPGDAATITIVATDAVSGETMRRAATLIYEVSETAGERKRQMVPPE